MFHHKVTISDFNISDFKISDFNISDFTICDFIICDFTICDFMVLLNAHRTRIHTVVVYFDIITLLTLLVSKYFTRQVSHKGF
jgi:hypothetical protein